MQEIFAEIQKEKSRIPLNTALPIVKENYLNSSISALKWGRERLIMSLATQ